MKIYVFFYSIIFILSLFPLYSFADVRGEIIKQEPVDDFIVQEKIGNFVRHEGTLVDENKIYINEDGKNKVRIYSGNPFYEKDNIFYTREYSTSTDYIKKDIIEKIIRLLVPYAYAMDYYSGNGDAYIRASDATWATAHGATTGTLDSTNTVISVGAQYTGGIYYIDRAGFFFDTATTTELEIESVVFYYYAWNRYNGDSDSVRFVNFTPTGDSFFNASDYNDFGTTNYAQVAMSTYDNVTYSQASTTLATSSVDLSNWTHIGIRTMSDINNTAPTGRNLLNIYASEYTGTGNDPYIEITYVVATTTEATSTSATVNMDETNFGIAMVLFLMSMVFGYQLFVIRS